jgi:hypothetical protein
MQIEFFGFEGSPPALIYAMAAIMRSRAALLIMDIVNGSVVIGCCLKRQG